MQQLVVPFLCRFRRAIHLAVGLRSEVHVLKALHQLHVFEPSVGFERQKVKTFARWYLQVGQHRVLTHQQERSLLIPTFTHFLRLEEEYTSRQKDSKLRFLSKNKKENDSKSILTVVTDDCGDQLSDTDAFPGPLLTVDATHPLSNFQTDLSAPVIPPAHLLIHVFEDAFSPEADETPPQLPILDGNFPTISLDSLFAFGRHIFATGTWFPTLSGFETILCQTFVVSIQL
jgi:hypothetical protein